MLWSCNDSKQYAVKLSFFRQTAFHLCRTLREVKYWALIHETFSKLRLTNKIPKKNVSTWENTKCCKTQVWTSFKVLQRWNATWRKTMPFDVSTILKSYVSLWAPWLSCWPRAIDVERDHPVVARVVSATRRCKLRRQELDLGCLSSYKSGTHSSFATGPK